MLGLQETTTQQGAREFGESPARSAWLRDTVADRADAEYRCGTVADWDGLWPDHARGLSSLTHPAAGRQTLGEPSVGFYGDLGVLYQQRGAQSQAIVEQLVDSGGEYAPVIDHALVADFNLNLSDQYAEMSNAQYWQDFSQNLGADFGALASLYDSVAQQNADLAAGHEQLALAAHNAYDHGLLVFDGVIQDQSFVYDALGNLTDRHDDAIDLAESFQYDVLNRVTGHSRSGQGAAFYELASLASITFQYDALGNLTHRSDTGSYAYGTGAGPHAVTAISGTETYHKKWKNGDRPRIQNISSGRSTCCEDKSFDFQQLSETKGRTMFKLLRMLFLSCVLLLAACGGGSSSGGGAGATMFAGTYNGTETLTITFQGETESGSGSITITISPNGTVTVVDDVGVQYQGPINNVSFTATGGAKGVTDPSVPGASCDISQTYIGSVNGDTITGTTSGTLTCTQGGVSFTASFSGNFTATLGG